MNLKHLNKLKSVSGFTLLEVLISVFLLIMISLAIFQATTSTYRLRDTLLMEGDFNNGVRLAMGILEKDVSLLYSPVMMAPPKKNGEAPLNPDELGRASKFWLQSVDRTGIRPSRFYGAENQIAFIAASHLRAYKDTAESEFQKISYSLDLDNQKDAPSGAKVLLRTASTNVFDDEEDRDKYKKIYPLLHGVKKLKFRYWDKEKDTWYNTWDNDSPDFKGKYPDLVEVTIEVTAGPRQNFEGLFKMRPEIPLRGINAIF